MTHALFFFAVGKISKLESISCCNNQVVIAPRGLIDMMVSCTEKNHPKTRLLTFSPLVAYVRLHLTRVLCFAVQRTFLSNGSPAVALLAVQIVD